MEDHIAAYILAVRLGMRPQDVFELLSGTLPVDPSTTLGTILRSLHEIVPEDYEPPWVEPDPMVTRAAMRRFGVKFKPGGDIVPRKTR